VRFKISFIFLKFFQHRHFSMVFEVLL
jgi:hypothetical protein